MRKAVISANGALTLQVARALKRVGLIWGSDIGLLGFDELELGGSWLALVLPPSNSRRGRSATPRSNR
ncbi:2-ketogluconate utilization repressor PtxS [Klebsiella variicola]|uniref:2-ketogluconate utilization repressor PtxS n=1 Tax=Klebsiella variicola TaxID=244366 RepID=A0A7H4M9I1_KLEVA|nr:2-ketogluconate utilization repressor PtxS [Klebsiella variicola]